MDTYIYLEKLRFYSCHGVGEQERLAGNRYEITLKIGYPFREAMQSDRLEDTLNYAAVYELIDAEMRIPSNLLEHVAGRIITRLTARFPHITSLDLKLSKLNPPILGEIPAVAVQVCFRSGKP